MTYHQFKLMCLILCEAYNGSIHEDEFVHMEMFNINPYITITIYHKVHARYHCKSSCTNWLRIDEESNVNFIIYTMINDGIDKEIINVLREHVFQQL